MGLHQWGATCDYIPKEDAVSPMLSTESNFSTATILASERRKVRCYDILSVFVNTDVDKDILIVLKRELAAMMVQIAPQIYRKYIMMDKKGTKILYVKLKRCSMG
jgi:hypothetical protein